MPRVLNAIQVDFAIESWAEDVVSHVSCVVCDFHHFWYVLMLVREGRGKVPEMPRRNFQIVIRQRTLLSAKAY